MLSYILKRILSLIPTVFVVSIVIFLVVYMVPGGPATALLGMEATPEAIAELNAELGFDRPFLVQYADWLINSPSRSAFVCICLCVSSHFIGAKIANPKKTNIGSTQAASTDMLPLNLLFIFSRKVNGSTLFPGRYDFDM